MGRKPTPKQRREQMLQWQLADEADGIPPQYRSEFTDDELADIEADERSLDNEAS
tara:strand:+ start:377 stop:541 length:165 start_codon:yes stop_codon:yes gene_type:complete